MPDLAYVEGQFVPLDQARVSINDRAFYYADAVYEVCTTFNGKVFLFDDHIDRLERSLRGVRINYRPDRRALAELIAEGVRRSGYRDALIYMQISRGVARREKTFPGGAEPTVLLTFREKRPLPISLRERGIDVLLVPDERWVHCDYKTIMLLPNVLAHQQAIDRGKHDAVFFDARKRLVREATSANLFLVGEGRLATPEQGPRILSGTVRCYVAELARRNGFEVEERPVPVEQLLRADEVFLTGTTTEILAVVRVDDSPIAHGVPGPVTRRLYALFQESVGVK